MDGKERMMETLAVFRMARAARDAGNRMRQLDWEKAKEICDQNKGIGIYAGLKDDMGYTAGLIFDGEKRVKDYVFVASIWATPILEVGGEFIECWKYGSDAGMPEWWAERDV